MIDLNEFKKSVVRVKSSHLINVFISDFDEIIDRAIAAESEREIPKTPEGFPELDNEHLIKICIQQQSKLAELEAQEPAIEYFMDGGFPNARFNGYQPKVGDKLYLQPIVNNSEPQRITEQDAREINFEVELPVIRELLKIVGHTEEAQIADQTLNYIIALRQEYSNLDIAYKLLERDAKLNEHRELVDDPVGEVVLFGGALKEISWKNGKLPPVGSKLYVLQVTPNKAEGPEHVNRIGDKKVTLVFSTCRACTDFINSLPPLKDE